MNAICKFCKEEIECKNQSEISIVEKYGSEVISHFECLYKSINGKEFDIKDLKPRKGN